MRVTILATWILNFILSLNRLVCTPWLLSLAGRVSLRVPLNSKVSLKWYCLPPLEQRDMVDILNSFSLSKLYVTKRRFSAQIYGPCASCLGLQFERKNSVHFLECGPWSRFLRGMYWSPTKLDFKQTAVKHLAERRSNLLHVLLSYSSVAHYIFMI